LEDLETAKSEISHYLDLLDAHRSEWGQVVPLTQQMSAEFRKLNRQLRIDSAVMQEIARSLVPELEELFAPPPSTRGTITWSHRWLPRR